MGKTALEIGTERNHILVGWRMTSGYRVERREEVAWGLEPVCRTVGARPTYDFQCRRRNCGQVSVRGGARRPQNGGHLRPPPGV
jgi:hypothetical protein